MLVLVSLLLLLRFVIRVGRSFMVWFFLWSIPNTYIILLLLFFFLYFSVSLWEMVVWVIFSSSQWMWSAIWDSTLGTPLNLVKHWSLKAQSTMININNGREKTKKKNRNTWKWNKEQRTEMAEQQQIEYELLKNQELFNITFRITTYARLK